MDIVLVYDTRLLSFAVTLTLDLPMPNVLKLMVPVIAPVEELILNPLGSPDAVYVYPPAPPEALTDAL
jgi:hypothetical protein